MGAAEPHLARLLWAPSPGDDPSHERMCAGHVARRSLRSFSAGDHREPDPDRTEEVVSTAETESHRPGERTGSARESTLASLLSFGAGVRWVIRGFTDLIDVVRSTGFLTPEDLQLGIKLYGVTPTRENMTQRLMPYVINIYNLGCTPGVSPAVIADWLKLENRPDELQDWSDDDLVDSDPETNREMLIGEFEREVERLQAIEKQVLREVDQPSLQNVLDRASILTEADARRVARSHSESRTTYHKASKDLWPLLEREPRRAPRNPLVTMTTRTGTLRSLRALGRPRRHSRRRQRARLRPLLRGSRRGRSRPVWMRLIVPKSNPRNRRRPRHKVLMLQSVRSRSWLRSRVDGTAIWAGKWPPRVRRSRQQRRGVARRLKAVSRVPRLSPLRSRSRAGRSRPVGTRPAVPKSNPRNRPEARHKSLIFKKVTSTIGRRLRVDRTAI